MWRWPIRRLRNGPTRRPPPQQVGDPARERERRDERREQVEQRVLAPRRLAVAGHRRRDRLAGRLGRGVEHASVSPGSGAEPRRQMRPNSASSAAAVTAYAATPERDRLALDRGEAALAGGGLSAHRSISSSSPTSPTLRAGTPITSARGGTSRVTTAPVATNASSPISIPGRIRTPPPTRAGAPDRRADDLVVRRVARHRVVVVGEHARAEEDVVLEHGERGHVAARLDPAARADHDVVVDLAAAPDHASRRRSRERSRTCAWSPTTARSPISAPALTIAPAAHGRAGADRGRRRRLARRRRARAERERLAEHGAVLQRHARAEHGAGVDHHVRADLRVVGQRDAVAEQQARARGQTVAARLVRARESCSASSTRTTRRPLSGPERGGRPSRDALDEVAALDPQRLLVRDPRAVDVARARDVLAVRREVLVEALVVDRRSCARAPCRRTSPSASSRRR